jgi:dihydrofolate reductase
MNKKHKIKMEIHIIACLDENNAIGYKNELLFRIVKDMRFFREKTLNTTIIMGRKTAESLPSMRPLKGRQNIVLTRNGDSEIVRTLRNRGFTCVTSWEHAMIASTNEIIYVIGGAQIYESALERDIVTSMFLTHVHTSFEAPEEEENPNEEDNYSYFPHIPENFSESIIREENDDEIPFHISHYMLI